MINYYTIIIYISILFPFWLYYHIQNIKIEAYDKGVKDGIPIGYNNGRDTIDEDMFEQGRESAFKEIEEIAETIFKKKAD